MVLRPTQPLTQMSTWNISLGGKGGRGVGLTTLPSSCADFHDIWDDAVSWNRQGLSGRIGLPFLYIYTQKSAIALYITSTHSPS
jgi:hypothetical protein